MNKGCRERRQRKRFEASKKDSLRYYRPNHPQHASGFSFDFKPGEKEKFFLNKGEPIYSPLNWSLDTPAADKVANQGQ